MITFFFIIIEHCTISENSENIYSEIPANSSMIYLLETRTFVL